MAGVIRIDTQTIAIPFTLLISPAAGFRTWRSKGSWLLVPHDCMCTSADSQASLDVLRAFYSSTEYAGSSKVLLHTTQQ